MLLNRLVFMPYFPGWKFCPTISVICVLPTATTFLCQANLCLFALSPNWIRSFYIQISMFVVSLSISSKFHSLTRHLHIHPSKNQACQSVMVLSCRARRVIRKVHIIETTYTNTYICPWNHIKYICKFSGVG